MHNANVLHKEKLSLTQKIASKITSLVGTFGCFVVFVILSSISLPAVVKANNPIIWVSWITQTFLQLVLLPLIMIGQNLQSAHSEHIAESIYKNTLDINNHIDELRAIKKIKK